MLLSYNLLKRYVDLEGIDAYECANKLTDCGIEVEEVLPVLIGTNLVTGYVEECSPHPDSDHLNLCKVNVGDEILNIVCGASNVSSGQYVIVAKVGAQLKDLTIKPTKIRGQESYGMICSMKELGLAEKYLTEEEKIGIKILPECELGIDPRIVLGLDDYTLDIKQTPNRSDFMSVYAIANEVGALFNREVRIPNSNLENIENDTTLVINSTTINSDYFVGKVINSIEVKPSVNWIKNALIGCGIKPINNVVDISNLVMLETGQPLHYYDAQFLENKHLEVRDDFEGVLTGLDGHEYTIEKGDLLIFNGDTPVGIAGIMGLSNSGIQPNSTGLVIESARFDRVRIRKTAARLGLSTDSSVRFSKPYDVCATMQAVKRSVDLLKEYANASDIEKTVVYGNVEFEPKVVSVTLNHINSLLGTHYTMDEVVEVYRLLKFNPIVNGNEITCTIPSYRLDIEIAEDLIEEVIRIIGFDQLEDTLPLLDMTSGAYTSEQTDVRYIEDYLLGLGANQINTYTLINEDCVNEKAIKVLSPLSEARSHLRTSLMPSILETIRYNQSYQILDLFVFEISKIYLKDSTHTALGIAASGSMLDQGWNEDKLKYDFFFLKGIIESVLDGLGINSKRLEYKNDEIDTIKYHPYQSATIYLNRKKIGTIGTVHPTYAKDLGIKSTVYAEINLTDVFDVKKAKTKYKSYSKTPVVIKDISVQLEGDIDNRSVISIIEKVGGKLIKNVDVIDVYQNNSVKAYTYSIALGNNETLTDSEIHDVLNKITNAINNHEKLSIR